MTNNESEFRVKVAIRVRPFLQREKAHEQKSCVAIHPQTNQIVIGDRRTFKYDFVFGPKTQQEELFQTSVEPMLSNVFDGYNVTVFAYGQTGSGKTFTMTGGNILSIGEKDYGIIPRAVKTVFDTLQNRKDCRVSISASYLEIYKDDIIDLLDVNDKVLDVRDDAIGNTIVIGASEHTCHSVDDVVNLLKKGSAVRHTGATQMNDESSRSHAIFTLYIEQRLRDKNSNSTIVQASYDGLMQPMKSTFDESYLSAKLHFVDLAGSERVARTHNTGERFQESIRINSGLLALGNVVSALSDPKKRAGGHIPYRDSKITRLLKDSLGGNAKTLMITCVSPCIVDLDESLNALKYAHRASQIRNKPIKNVDPNAQRFIEMQSEITYLREELERQRTMLSRNGQSVNTRRSNITPRNDHSRRLIQTAYTCFQQLNECNELNDEQKQLIQTWMESVTNENIEDFYNDIYTCRVTNLENALHTTQDELRSESQMRINREMMLEKLQEELKTKEDELNRIRTTLDEANYRRKQQEDIVSKLQTGQQDQSHLTNAYQINQSTAKNASYDRIKSAPHFGGIQRKDQSIQPRNIHSSPAAFDMEYVVERFHGRSLALAHSQEEIEELNLKNNDDTITEENKFVRHGTYRIRKNRVIPSILQRDETIQSLTQSTMNKQKLIDEATRKVKEAESKAQDLSINIHLKEQLIKSVYVSTNDVQETNEQYQKHIKLLEKEMEKAKHEYQDLQKTMQQIASKNINEKSKFEAEYRKKCEMAKAHLDSLQQKEKQYRELMIKLNGNSEKRIADLQATLFRMKQQYETAQKRIREETEVKNKIEQELIREQQRIQDLTIQNEQQQKILKLKTEGLVAAQRKLRGASNINSNDGITIPNFDIEMEKLMSERKDLETLRDDIQKREELIQKKELLLNEKTELETKKLRSSQILNKSLKINDKQQQQQQQPNHQIIREQLLQQKRLFTERLEEQNGILSPTEERRLIEIDEAIEAIDLAIDYQNNIISKRERDVQQSMRSSQGSDSALFKIGQLNENESRELCRKLFEKVVDLKEGDNKNRRDYEEIKSQLLEQTEIINDLQSRIQSLSLDHDRRLTSIQQLHEEEKQLLLGKLQESSNQIKQLEKDLYFYKHKTRELRKSMATSITNANDIPTQQTESNTNEYDQRKPRSAVEQQQSAPFLLKIGNRSNSAHQS